MDGPLGTVEKRVSRALSEYRLIEAGDRVLVAVSGGKDSLALAWALAKKARGWPVPFEAAALHLDTGFSEPGLPGRLAELCGSWGLSLETLPHPPAEECFGCSRGRRRALLEYASERGFSKVALGHHMDDALATLLMNMVYSSEASALPPRVPAEEGRPALIRPLILLQEETIARAAAREGWPVDRSRCPRAGDSRRTEMAAAVEALTGGSPRKKLNMWNSLPEAAPAADRPQRK